MTKKSFQYFTNDPKTVYSVERVSVPKIAYVVAILFVIVSILIEVIVK